MMGSFSETEDQFFDTRDDVSSVSDLGSDCSEDCVSSGLRDSALGYDFWTKKPDSVDERRDKFLKMMGFGSDWHRTDIDENEYSSHEVLETSIDRLRDNGEAVLANLDSEPKFFSSNSFQSFRSYNTTEAVEDGAIDENLKWKIKNLDNGTEFVVGELAEDGTCTTLHEVGSDKMISLDEFQKTLGSSAIVRELFRKDCKWVDRVDSRKKMKTNWLQRFSAIAHIAEKTKGLLDKNSETSSSAGSTTTTRTRGVRVNVTKKRSKELSSLYTGQEFPAHEGSILTMKFSFDGRHLASAGVDGVVRVWDVLEDDIVNKFSGQDSDPSCLYLSLSNSSKLTPLDFVKEKTSESKNSGDSACVILPHKVFQLSEKPVHEFHGHSGEVLSLSWSKNGHLLSSSVDKTARLWKVGHDECLGTYSHNNYVTCVDFNPVDDNYFISGSLDGKVRIWEVEGGRVIDWIDIREIVTAVCYCPDGKGGVVGSMNGNCRFYDIIDNRLEMGTQVCMKGKKLPGKRITGFQYCPNDTSKVMVTSADSQVRIISGTKIVSKFKGNKSSGCQGAASFTSDGQHIVSATEDSNVRVWNYSSSHNQKTSTFSSSSPKSIKSNESFTSCNASIAIPWSGLKNKLGSLPGLLSNGHLDEKLFQKLPPYFPDCFTMSLGFFLDALHKGSSPTWPEENLPKSRPAEVKNSLGKSEFKFLKNAWMSALNSPHLWGLVIVTAGWDGCIRTFLNYGLPIRF